MVCARRLQAWGAKVYVGLSSPKGRITPVPRHQLDILERMDIDIFEGKKLEKLPKPDLIIDGIIGYSIKGDPYGQVKQLIEWANAQDAPILSLDTPSGLNLTTGEVHVPCIKAAATPWPNIHASPATSPYPPGTDCHRRQRVPLAGYPCYHSSD